MEFWDDVTIGLLVMAVILSLVICTFFTPRSRKYDELYLDHLDPVAWKHEDEIFVAVSKATKNKISESEHAEILTNLVEDQLIETRSIEPEESLTYHMLTTYEYRLISRGSTRIHKRKRKQIPTWNFSPKPI